MNEVKSGITGASAISGDRTVRDGVEVLREDFRKLGGDLTDTARHAANAAKDGVVHAKERAVDAYDAVRERAGEAVSSAKEHAKNAKDKVGTKIEDHPFMAIGIAFGAGFLLAALLRSRR